MRNCVEFRWDWGAVEEIADTHGGAANTGVFDVEIRKGVENIGSVAPDAHVVV